MLLVPIPAEVTARVETYAAGLGVADDMMQVVRRFANGSLGLALIDFERSGYFQQLLAEPPEHLHTRSALSDAWETASNDTALYEQWAALEALPRRIAGPRGVALLPGPWLHVPGSTRQRAAQPRAARLDPRARRLRLDRGVGDRGVRPHRPLQRRPAGVLAARDGARPVRDRLPLRRRQGLLRVRPGPPLARRRPHGGAARRRDVPRGDARVARQRRRPGSQRPTCSPPTGSPTPTARSTKCAPSRHPAAVRSAPSPRVRRRRGSRAASRRSSSRTDARSRTPKAARTTPTAPNPRSDSPTGLRPRQDSNLRPNR